MLKKAVLILLAAMFGLSVYPWYDNPTRYVHWVDRFKAVPLGELMLGRPCVREIDAGDWNGEGLVGAYDKDRISILDESPNCLRYLPSSYYRGVWIDGFENQSFLELGLIPYSRELYWKLLGSRDTAWMMVPEDMLDAHQLGERPKYLGEYLVEFKGRRTKEASTFGHRGAYDHQMWVDEIISIEPLPPLKPEDLQR